MSTNPLASPKFRAFDSNGDPLSGGKLYSYSAGTTNALSTYTTRAGSVANANPVVLDANGEADVWMTPGVDYKFVLKNSADVTQWTVDNVPSPTASDTTFDVATDPGGRLTLTTATPVTTSNVTGATTVYYTAYKHNRIPIWNGTEWVLETMSSELSQTTTDTTRSPAAVANNSNYDLFVWMNSGTMTLSRGPAWTSDTGRGTGAGTTEITRLNGRYVNAATITNGPAASRGTYVGTVRSDGSAQLNDAEGKRRVWNCYNRVRRTLYVIDNGSSYTYTLATVRQVRAAATNQVDFVFGLSEDAVAASASTTVANTGAGVAVQFGFGLDTITALGSSGSHYDQTVTQVANQRVALNAFFDGLPGLGYHYLAMNESSSASGTTTWLGTGSIILNGSCLA